MTTLHRLLLAANHFIGTYESPDGTSIQQRND